MCLSDDIFASCSRNDGQVHYTMNNKGKTSSIYPAKTMHFPSSGSPPFSTPWTAKSRWRYGGRTGHPTVPGNALGTPPSNPFNPYTESPQVQDFEAIFGKIPGILLEQ